MIPLESDGFVVLALGGAAALALIALIVARPAFAAYSYLAVSPLIVGIARGEVTDLLRPNEALLLVIVMALAIRSLIAMLGRTYVPTQFTGVDLALLLMAAASSVMPLMERIARGLTISSDDMLYSIVLWKYFVLYRCCRASITTPTALRRCIWTALASGAMSCVIGLMQVGDLFGVPAFLHSHFDQPFEGTTTIVTGRATSTVASSFGFADVMIMNLLMAMAWLVHARRPRLILAAASLLFICGAIASGEFSSFIGLGVALVAFGIVSGQIRILLTAAAPSVLVGATVFWFVIAKRVGGFDRASSSLPASWNGRWTNLQTFFLPRLMSDFNWLWGVQPAPRIVAPEHWRQFVYIESGYVWILWIGGLPFAAAFAFFVWMAGRQLWRAGQTRQGDIATVAQAGFSYLVTMLALMLLDPHLTLRGSADLFFPLLAFSFVGERYGERAGRGIGSPIAARFKRVPRTEAAFSPE